MLLVPLLVRWLTTFSPVWFCTYRRTTYLYDLSRVTRWEPCNLHYLARVARWEPRDSYDLAHVACVGSVLYRSRSSTDPAYHPIAADRALYRI